MTVTQDSTVRSFPPEPVSARDARRFLRSFLLERSRDDLVDAAATALSELVTNAVLHAHTAFEVSAALLVDGTLRVEVTDSSPQLPAQRRYGEQATTGRGMQLVAAMTADCGVVSNGARGKTVWFLVQGSPDEQAPGAEWDEAPAAPVPTDGKDRVLLLGLPPTLWLATRQHHDAILRELVLFAQEHPEQAPSSERLAQADRARGIVSTAVVAALQRRAAGAPATGRAVRFAGAEPPLDLRVQLPHDAAATYTALQEVLDVAERLAGDGALLARPGLPEVVEVRRWVCEQILGQQGGAPPSPWQGLVEDRPLADRRRTVPAHWDADDLADVVGAGHGAVAADDTNRILAVSRPLAQALGWDVGDLVGRRLVAIVPPELREAHVAGFSRHVTTGETHILGAPVQLPVLCADGSRLLCDVLIQRRSSVTGRDLYVASVEPVR